MVTTFTFYTTGRVTLHREHTERKGWREGRGKLQEPVASSEGKHHLASATLGWHAMLTGKCSSKGYLFNALNYFAITAAFEPAFEFFQLYAAIQLSLTMDNRVSQPFQYSVSSSLQLTIQVKYNKQENPP